MIETRGTEQSEECLRWAEGAAREASRCGRSWRAFLDLAGRVHRYGFLNQLLIYRQAPTAAACGWRDVWEQRMGRDILEEAAPIKVLREQGGHVDVQEIGRAHV